MWSLAETLEHLGTRLPPTLIPDDARDRLHATAARLPARLTNGVFIELWPRDHGTRADLIVRLDARGRDCLIDASLADFEPDVRASLGWRRIASFARAWASSDDGLDRAIEGAWIEFDLDPSVASPWLRPRLFVDLAIDARQSPRDHVMAIVRQIARAVFRRPFLAEISHTLRHCIEQLPAGATLRYVGCVPDRPEAGLRLCVSRLGSSWRTYLAAIGWPGDPALLEDRIVAPMREARGVARPAIDVLHLDLIPVVSPRLGLEYAFGRTRQHEGIVDEVEVLERIVAHGWSDRATFARLQAWPGRSVELLPAAIWYNRVSRFVSHIKISFVTEQPIVMKTYLCAFFELTSGGAMLGDRPWHTEASRSAGARFDGARARLRGDMPDAIAQDPTRLSAHTRDRVSGNEIASGDRK